MLQSMGWQRVKHDLSTELQTTSLENVESIQTCQNTTCPDMKVINMGTFLSFLAF